MTEYPESRKPAHTTDTSDTEFFERLQRLNNTYGNGRPVPPPPSQTRLHTPEHGNTPPTTPREHGVSPQPDLVRPPPATPTLLPSEGHDTTPHTTTSDTSVSPQTDPIIPSRGPQQDRSAHEILGGTCPMLPMQCCLIWAARKEKMITPLALKVYFAAHEVKYWRAHVEPGDTYHYEPFGFQPLDVGRLLSGVSETQIARAFAELAALNILTVTPQGVWFAESLEDIRVTERVTRRVTTMFALLHEKTRDTIIKIPRRLLKLLVQCGRRLVRAATLLGMLLTTLLTKRTDRYGGYKGCCKAAWIAKLFGVNASRVKSERHQLIA